MNLRKIAILFLALVFPAFAFASEPGQSEPEGEPSSVNVLGETEERSQEVTVRAMTLREILFQRLRERHAAGLDTDIPESFIENLSDEAIEEIFRQADEEEDFDLGVLTEDEGEDEQEDSTAAEGNSSLLDFLRENKGILAATAAGATAFAAVGYGFAKEDEDFDGDEYEDDDDYEDTETASADPDDSFFSWGCVAEAGALYGGGGGNIDTGEAIPTAQDSTPIVYYGTDISIPFGNLAKRAGEMADFEHPEFIWAQMMIETGGPEEIKKSQWQIRDHNYTGLTWEDRFEGASGMHIGELRPPEEGGNYVRFDTDEDFLRLYTETLMGNKGLNKAATPEEFARILKANNYYESEEEEYAETIKELIDEYKEEFASAEWKEKNQLPILNQLHSDI